MALPSTQLDIQLRYSAHSILVVCSGSSGEAYQVIGTAEAQKLIQRSQSLHRYVDYLIRIGREQTVPKTQRNRLGNYMRRVGEQIYNSIFRGEIADLLNIAIGQAIRLETDVQIAFMIASDFLNLIPWELACADGSYLSHVYDVFRRPFILQPSRRPHRSDGRLKVSFLCSNPRHDIFVDGQIEAVANAIKGLPDKITFSECRDANFTRIADEIFSGVDVLHFLAHGEFQESGGVQRGYFLIEGEGEDKEDRLPVEMLQSFCRSNPMRFVVLNACRSDQGLSYSQSAYKLAGATEYYSMAHGLLRTGVPCVIGMSHPISKAGADIFSKRLYKVILAQEETITRAIRQIRLELFAHSESLLPSDWFSPVLYSRGFDALGSPLFDTGRT